MTITALQRDIVRSCVPALREHGESLTRNFYARMFSANPALKHIFNMSHQATGTQQKALAMAVLAYAEHIDDPSLLTPVLNVIVAKHVSMGIRAEHYPIVGRHLLDAIAEVMGEAATPALIDAWAVAYAQLASLLIDAEQALYSQAATSPGGWSGWRPFHIIRTVRESSEITSFYLVPTDGGALPSFRPGQFVSVHTMDAEGMTQIRQYSLSDAPHNGHFRLTVKREDAHRSCPGGKVSTQLHREFHQGDVLELSFPQGNFTVDESRDTPLVMLSGGVGITPMLGMLGHVVKKQPSRPVYFYHAARNRQVQAMGDWLRGLASNHQALDLGIYYEQVDTPDVVGTNYDRQGRIDASEFAAKSELAEADYYVCGPRAFMTAQIESLKATGVPETRIHAEFFGASLD